MRKRYAWLYRTSTRLDAAGCSTLRGPPSSLRPPSSHNPPSYVMNAFPLSHESLMTPGRSGSRNSRRQLRRKWERRSSLLLCRASVTRDELPLRVELVKGSVRISNRCREQVRRAECHLRLSTKHRAKRGARRLSVRHRSRVFPLVVAPPPRARARGHFFLSHDDLPSRLAPSYLLSATYRIACIITTARNSERQDTRSGVRPGFRLQLGRPRRRAPGVILLPAIRSAGATEQLCPGNNLTSA